LNPGLNRDFQQIAACRVYLLQAACFRTLDDPTDYVKEKSANEDDDADDLA
jgi:hypothetical protein